MEKELRNILFIIFGLPLFGGIIGFMIAVLNQGPLEFSFFVWLWIQIISLLVFGGLYGLGEVMVVVREEDKNLEER